MVVYYKLVEIPFLDSCKNRRKMDLKIYQLNRYTI
nr:MAG TPA: hypothetical protein [Caudoviricetes sp.]